MGGIEQIFHRRIRRSSPHVATIFPVMLTREHVIPPACPLNWKRHWTCFSSFFPFLPPDGACFSGFLAAAGGASCSLVLSSCGSTTCATHAQNRSHEQLLTGFNAPACKVPTAHATACVRVITQLDDTHRRRGLFAEEEVRGNASSQRQENLQAPPLRVAWQVAQRALRACETTESVPPLL